MKNYLKTIIKTEKGYATVEMLLIIAGVGLLATLLFNSLTTSLVGEGNENSTVKKVTKGIDTMVDGWITDANK